jgi:fructose-bisphosphate aldolase class II
VALVNTAEILQSQPFVLAVNVIMLEQAEAFVASAEESGTGLVLQLSENTVEFHGGLEPLALALFALARKSSQKISVHLDHATDPKLVKDAISLGFTSVMFDGSSLDFEENLEKTAELAALAAKNKCWFEAELGEVGGKDGVHAPGIRTNPEDAKEFVMRTEVNGLAVAVGSSHAMLEKSADLDFELIAQLSAAVSVPLVLHGSSGVSRANLKLAIRSGISKVNLATELNVVFNQAMLEAMQQAKPGDPRKFLRPAREALTRYLTTLIRELS